MAKAELKTKKTAQSVTAFVNSQSLQQKKDCKTIIKMMRSATGSKPCMWGTSLVGFGEVHLKYASGRELDWFKIGFSPRKKQISLYVLSQHKQMNSMLKKLGPHKTGKGCLYVKRLDELDLEVLGSIFTLACDTKMGGCA